MSKQHKPPGNATVIIFVISLACVCSLVLSLLASMLKPPQEVAKELDRSEQMLMAAKIYSPQGFFLMKEGDDYVPAKHVGSGRLEKGSEEEKATGSDVLTVYRARIRPRLVDAEGNVTTFEEAGIDEKEYVADHKAEGYWTQPLKLVYEVIPNSANGQSDQKPEAYVFPVNGFGLWDAIYGYLAIAPDGNTVIGISWYEHAETPGLGANIAEASWQQQFPGKQVFLPNPSGETNFKVAPIGITVVRGKVSEVLGASPKADNAVDGMAGATLTGNGVTKAYKDSLSSYRPFLIKLHNQYSNS